MTCCDLRDQELRVCGNPARSVAAFRDSQRAVRQPQSWHHLDGEGVEVVRIIEETLDHMGAQTGQANLLRERARGNSEQVSHLTAGVFQRGFSASVTGVPVRVIVLAEHHDQVDVMYWVALRTA